MGAQVPDSFVGRLRDVVKAPGKTGMVWEVQVRHEVHVVRLK